MRRQVGPALHGRLPQGLDVRQRVGHGHLGRRRRQRIVRRPMQQRVDPRHGHATVALDFGTAAFQVGQINVGLEHVLLGGLRHFVLALGDLAKLAEAASAVARLTSASRAAW